MAKGNDSITEFLMRDRREKQKLAAQMKSRRRRIRFGAIPPNPFVAVDRSSPLDDKPDLTEFKIDDEWLQDAVAFQISKQRIRDGLRYLVREEMIRTGRLLRDVWTEYITQATANYVRSSYATPFSYTEKIANVFYLERYAPSEEKTGCDLGRNERKWYIGISLNRNRSAASLLSWGQRTLVPFVLSAIRLMANIEMRGAVVFSPEDMKRLRVELGEDRRNEIYLCSRDQIREFGHEARSNQRLSRTKLRGRLMALACYRYYQSGYGWEVYDREQKKFGLETDRMSREKFRQRLRIAVAALRYEWDWAISARLEQMRGIHFPLGKMFPAETR